MGLGPITVGITADISNFAKEAKKGFSDAMPDIDLSAKALGRMAGEAINTGVKVGMLAIGATVAAALAGAAYAVQSFTSQGLVLADNLADTSAKLGVSATSLLLYGEAARQTGTDVEAVQQAMSKLNIKVGEAMLGNATAVQSFADLGISMQQLKGLAPEQQFQLVADAIGRIPDATIRAASAVDIFGKSGSNIVASLGDIGAKSQELAQYWMDLGATISNEQINAAGGIQDHLDLMHDGLDRFKILLASEMVPLLDMVLTLFEDQVKEVGGLDKAAKKTADTIAKLVAMALDFGQGLYGVGQILKGVGKIITAIGEGFTAMFMYVQSAGKIAFGTIGWALSSFGHNAVVQFRKLGDFIGETFSNVFRNLSIFFVGMLNKVVDGWNWLVDKTGVGSKADHFKVTEGEAFKKATPGPVETGLLKFMNEMTKMIEDGNKLAATTTKNLEQSKTIEEAFASLSDGAKNFMDAAGKGDASWGDDFKKKLAESIAGAVDGKSGKKTNQELIDEYNKTHGMPSNNIGTGAPGSSGLYLPSSATRNTGPSASSGPPVTVNQTFASGFDAQSQRQLAQTIKRETIAAVQTKVAQGGNYRREIQC